MTENPLLAEQLRADSDIQTARQLLQQSVARYSAQLTDVRPPREALREDYQSTLERFSQLRGGNLYYPFLGTGIGNGPLVELADGSVKFDLISGIGVHLLGHSHPALIDAAFAAAVSDTVMQGNLQQNLDSVRLSELFVEMAQETGASLNHCFLSTSGAMANENALKLVFQSRSPANRLLAFENCFCGRTLALGQITDRPGNRSGMPTTLAVDYVPFFDPAAPEESIPRTLAALDRHLARYPDQHAGMMVELIQGEGGYRTAPREFFVALLERLKTANVAVLVDEVQSFGRTTRAFAFQHYELDPWVDVVTVGKMSQLCATLFTDDMKPRPGLISQTFTGATSSIHASHAILSELKSGGYLGPEGRIVKIHERFTSHFERLAKEYPDWIQGPWGIGGMIAFTPRDGDAKLARRLLDVLFEIGVIAFPAGSSPTRIRMLPPIVISDEQIDKACDLIGQAIARVRSEECNR